MAVELVTSSQTCDQQIEIVNDNFIDLDGRVNDVELGVDAYSTTSASFVQPAVSATVSVTVDETGWMAVGQPVYMTTGGTYTVSSVTDTTHVVLTNLGYSGNASVGATVASGKKVSPSGFGDTSVTPSRQINTTSPITGGGSLAADRTIAHANSGVTAGSYTSADITIDATGHITTAASGSGGSGGGSGGFAPVLVATTGDITLSGTQTIDDIGVVAGDRVLVWQQSTDTQNGIYVVAAGAWSRAADANTSAEFTDGREVFIRPAGTTYSNYIAIAGPFAGGFSLGTHTVTFVMATPVASEATYGMAITATQGQVDAGDAGEDLMVTPETMAAYTGITDKLLTADYQARDPKDSVRVATTANITLSGAQTIDGISVVAGNRVLVKNQTTGSQNGIYLCASGAWTRTTDANTSAKVTPQMYVRVEEGTANVGKAFYLSNTGTVTLGTTALTFADAGGSGAVSSVFTRTGAVVAASGDYTATQITNTPAGNIAATTAQAAINELDTEKAAASDLTAHTGDTSDAHDASAISFVPAGTIAATDVQAAIEEVASEGGGGGGTTLPVTDTTALVKDPSDATKLVRIDAGNVATGTTRVITMPNADVDLGEIAAHEADTTDAHDATAISFAPAGTIAATTVQAAIEEVASEAGGGSSESPDWMNQTSSALFAAFGDGNPQTASFLQLIAPTLTNNLLSATTLTTSVAHAIKFRLPKALSVSAVRLLPVGNTTNLFRVGIYPATAASSLLWDSGTFTTVTGTWQNLTASTPFSLATDTDYYFCVAVVSTSATNAFNTLPSHAQTSFFGAAAAPLGGKSIGMPEMVQFAVTTGVLPSTLPTIAAIASGPSVPFAWFEGTAS